MSHTERYFENKNASPGPGAYHVKSEVDTPRYSMNSRRSPSNHEENPGPGAYSPSISFTAINYSIAHSDHLKPSKNSSPGPGSYFPKSEKSPGMTIGISKRSPLSLVLDTPGPGSYNSLNTYKAPAYTISKQSNIQKLGSDPVFFI